MSCASPDFMVIAEQLALPGVTGDYSIGEIERIMVEEGVEVFIGVDEVGRGPLAGPVVATAVILGKDFLVEGVRDSKELSSEEREKLFPVLCKSVQSYSTSRVGARKIDKINIREASRLAMKQAVEACAREFTLKYGKAVQMVLVDGRDLLDIEYPQKAVVKGDKRSISIAAASIIAKVTRDRLMVRCHNEFPNYGFERNMGYPTPEHLEALKKYGACPYHRRSFEPVAAIERRREV